MASLQRVTTYTIQFLAAISLFACSDLREPVPTNAPASFHPADWANEVSGGLHTQFIRESGWDLKGCQECHGTRYDGGITNSSCLTCHPATPEDCTVCHGGVDNATGAPPEDLDGNRDSSAHGVGVHTAHLSAGQFAAGFECSTCHLVPDSLYAAGHIDGDDHAEVIFGLLALVDEAQPSWDSDAESCNNTYCHGNWNLSRANSNFASLYAADEMVGNNASPSWTDPETAACGSCHGLPPTGHNPFDLNECAGCHAAVIDASGAITDKPKHVNGMINVFGQEIPFPAQMLSESKY